MGAGWEKGGLDSLRGAGTMRVRFGDRPDTPRVRGGAGACWWREWGGLLNILRSGVTAGPLPVEGEWEGARDWGAWCRLCVWEAVTQYSFESELACSKKGDADSPSEQLSHAD